MMIRASASGRMTVRMHLRAARQHRKRARMWERMGERELAALEWSRATIHRRAAELKRGLNKQVELQAA
jgi:hypothetical protein